MARIEGLRCEPEISAQSPDLWEHPLVERLVPDPTQLSSLGVIKLTGFLGRSAFPDCKRLYRDADLREWDDIPEVMILCEYRSGVGRNMLDKDVVWIDRSRAGSERRGQFP